MPRSKKKERKKVELREFCLEPPRAVKREKKFVKDRLSNDRGGGGGGDC